MTAARLVVGTRLAYGVWLFALPRRALELTGSAATGRTGTVMAMRLLGARDVAQAVLLGARHPRLSSGIDGLHALSMLLLAVLRPRLRDAAGASAVISGLWVLASRAGRAPAAT